MNPDIKKVVDTSMNFNNFKDPFNMILQKKRSIGEPPGTLSYTGLHTNIGVKIDVISYDHDWYQRMEITDLESLEVDDKKYWINITGLHDIELIRRIGDKFGIHHMDLEDVVHVSQRSKIELKEFYLFSIFKMIYLKNEDIHHEHVSIFVKDKVILTFQEVQGDVFEGIRKRIESGNDRIVERGIEYLYYSIIDAIVDHYFPVINQSFETFADLEVNVIETGNTDMTRIYQLRKELLYMVNAITPIHDAILIFTRESNPYFTKEDVPYYADLMDHLTQLGDSLKSYREMINSLYEMQMAEKSNALNKTMMTLTTFSVIFIPLSFLAGFFGMNFIHFPGLDYPYAIQLFIATCMTIAAGMLVYFKVKRM